VAGVRADSTKTRRKSKRKRVLICIRRGVCAKLVRIPAAPYALSLPTADPVGLPADKRVPTRSAPDGLFKLAFSAVAKDTLVTTVAEIEKEAATEREPTKPPKVNSAAFKEVPQDRAPSATASAPRWRRIARPSISRSR